MAKAIIATTTAEDVLYEDCQAAGKRESGSVHNLCGTVSKDGVIYIARLNME